MTGFDRFGSGREGSLDGVAQAQGARRAQGDRKRARSGRILGLCLVVVLAASLAGASSASAGNRVMAWGSNEYGELGVGTATGPEVCTPFTSNIPRACSRTPVEVPGLGSATALSPGDRHALALLSNGTVMAWGRNERGQLGDGNTAQSDLPVAVTGLSGVAAISAGDETSLALLSNHTVVAWGLNAEGQLGDGTTSGPESCGVFPEPCSTKPVPVSGLSAVTSIAAGYHHELALLSNGRVMAWGSNGFGELGIGGNALEKDLPTLVCAVGVHPCPSGPYLEGVKAIAASDADSLALLENGTVVAWGANSEGELGDGSTAGPESCNSGQSCSFSPVVVSGLSGVAAISDGDDDGLALLGNGTVEDWGENAAGELGDGTHTLSAVPVPVSGLSGVKTATAGGGIGLALLSSGTVTDWGDNYYGGLGTGSVVQTSAVPVTVAELSGVQSASSTAEFSLAIEPEPVPRWYSNGVLIPEGEAVAVKTGGPLTLVHVDHGEIEVACKVSDKEVIENPRGGGPGVDRVTAFKMSGCLASAGEGGKGEVCSAKPPTAVVSGLPWITREVPGTPARDEIDGVALEVKCASFHEAFTGTLEPIIGNSVLQFTTATGELRGAGGSTPVVGTDDLEGPKGDERITDEPGKPQWYSNGQLIAKEEAVDTSGTLTFHGSGTSKSSEETQQQCGEEVEQEFAESGKSKYGSTFEEAIANCIADHPAEPVEFTIKCKKTDKETLLNPEKLSGRDEVSEFTLSHCTAKPSPCPAHTTVEVLATGLPWPSRLVPIAPIEDAIEGMGFEIRCSGTPFDLFTGALMPTMGNSVDVFSVGSGELEDGHGGKLTVSGSDKIKGPPGDEKITAAL